jgi:hypothetical protein
VEAAKLRPRVDIHHVFPKAWCEKASKDWRFYDTIINKTPLGYRTNRILGGAAPSAYLARLEKEGAPPIGQAALDRFLLAHLIDPARLRADGFEGFMADREVRLLALIARATGHRVESDAGEEEGEEPAEGGTDEIEDAA